MSSAIESLRTIPGFSRPNSRVIVQYSTRKEEIPQFTGMAVEPDVPVSFNGADFFNQQDPFLQAALAR